MGAASEVLGAGCFESLESPLHIEQCLLAISCIKRMMNKGLDILGKKSGMNIIGSSVLCS